MDHIDLEMTFPAPPQRLWAALSEAAWLERWFAEHAELVGDPAAPGIFRFWGRYSPGNPGRDAAEHPITAFEIGRRLTFAWPWSTADGAERTTRVAWEVGPDGSDGSRLHLLHEDVGEWQSGFSWADYWYSVLEILRARLAGREPGVRPDFSRELVDPVTLALTLDAPPEEVFEALIDPAQLTRYFPTTAEIERREGGRIDFGWDGGGPRGSSPWRRAACWSTPGSTVGTRRRWCAGSSKVPTAAPT